MTTKKKLLTTCFVGVTVVAVALGVHFVPRQYYRYQGGHVYLARDPDCCWNGLRGSPTLQFAVPLFADAKSWSPTPEQIRKELRRSDPGLSESEIGSILQSCVACGSSTN
jgi:hypothetical protein